MSGMDGPLVRVASRARRRHSTVREVAVTVVLALLLYWILSSFVFQTYRVEGSSMDHTLANGQRLFIDKLTPHFAPYGRGDIVVLEPPASEHSDTPFIKRVIGLGREHVSLKGGHVYIDGTLLDEPYLDPGVVTLPKGTSSWDVDPGDLLVMGDNREGSEDGRMFGEIPASEVIGRAWVRFWPLDVLGLIGRPTYPGPTPGD